MLKNERHGRIYPSRPRCRTQLWRVVQLRNARTHALQESQTSANPLRYTIQAARNSAELRAVAHQRVVAFWNEDSSKCSEFAAKLNLRSKAASTWDYLEDRISQHDSGKAKFACLYASIGENHAPDLVASLKQTMDLSSMLPEHNEHPRIVIGSLDLSVGQRLAGEQLAGPNPSGDAALNSRAYLSNVSVAKEARRMGIAASLIEAACSHAKEFGISHLYVHAAVDNQDALNLYQNKCGFELIQQEDGQIARLLNRPCRMLLERVLSSTFK